MSKKIRILLTVCAALLLVVGSVAGTMAWLQDSTGPITNTFTPTLVDIELKETTGSTYKLLPGSTIGKDPKVTVKAGSERCWVFVKIDETDPKEYISYAIADGWIAYDTTANPGLYYREVAATANNIDFLILKDNLVHVSETVPNGVTTAPTLTFTAYAIQYDANKLNTPETAWAAVKPLTPAEPEGGSSSDSSTENGVF